MLEAPGPRPAQLFFIHGTQQFTHNGNIASNDKPAKDNSALGQATAFYDSCDVFAPFYRQATFAGGDWETAYQDVRQAFEVFLQERDPTRPIVLCGHSQGGVMVRYILRDFFSEGSALREALAVAFAPGVAAESTIAAGTEISGVAGLGSSFVWCTTTEDAKAKDTLLGKYGDINSCNPMDWGPSGAPVTLGADMGGKPVLYEVPRDHNP